MILFLTLLWIAGLALAVRAGWIQLTLWWKLSPVLWSLFLLVALMVPLQSWAPSGSFITGHQTVAIVPEVNGQVTAIQARPNTPLKKGAPLFSIDKSHYQAALDNAEASFSLAQIYLEQQAQLLANGAGRKVDLDRATAQVQQKQANYQRARLDLQSTQVHAPEDGYVTNMTIRTGAMVTSLGNTPAMAFVDTSERFYGGFIAQSYLRNIAQGQEVEIALKAYPGEVFAAEVEYLIPARATGLESMSGLPVAPRDITHAPFAVRIKPSAALEALNLPSGSTGRMVIYTGEGVFAHMIRTVDIRIEAILNYINPF
jgi:multidrug resistance efflux pump